MTLHGSSPILLATKKTIICIKKWSNLLQQTANMSFKYACSELFFFPPLHISFQHSDPISASTTIPFSLYIFRVFLSLQAGRKWEDDQPSQF